MQRRRTAVLVALLAAFLLFSWWLALSPPDVGDEPIASAEPQPAPAQPLPPQAAPPQPAAAPQPTAAPAPQPAAPAPAPAPDPAQAPAAGPIPPDTRGFTDALQSRFEADPRDSGAGEVEAAVRKLYRAPRMPSGLLRSVLCHETVCKLELRWLPEHDPAYRNVFEHLEDGNAKLVATRAGAPDAHGAVDVDLYWVRRPLP